MPVFVNGSVLLPYLLCSLLGASRSRGEVMDRGVLLPSSKLIADLYAVLRSCHGGNGNKRQSQEKESIHKFCKS